MFCTSIWDSYVSTNTASEHVLQLDYLCTVCTYIYCNIYSRCPCTQIDYKFFLYITVRCSCSNIVKIAVLTRSSTYIWNSCTCIYSKWSFIRLVKTLTRTYTAGYFVLLVDIVKYTTSERGSAIPEALVLWSCYHVYVNIAIDKYHQYSLKGAKWQYYKSLNLCLFTPIVGPLWFSANFTTIVQVCIFYCLCQY